MAAGVRGIAGVGPKREKLVLGLDAVVDTACAEQREVDGLEFGGVVEAAGEEKSDGDGR